MSECIHQWLQSLNIQDNTRSCVSTTTHQWLQSIETGRYKTKTLSSEIGKGGDSPNYINVIDLNSYIQELFYFVYILVFKKIDKLTTALATLHSRIAHRFYTITTLTFYHASSPFELIVSSLLILMTVNHAIFVFRQLILFYFFALFDWIPCLTSCAQVYNIKTHEWSVRLVLEKLLACLLRTRLRKFSIIKSWWPMKLQIIHWMLIHTKQKSHLCLHCTWNSRHITNQPDESGWIPRLLLSPLTSSHMRPTNLALKKGSTVQKLERMDNIELFLSMGSALLHTLAHSVMQTTPSLLKYKSF